MCVCSLHLSAQSQFSSSDIVKNNCVWRFNKIKHIYWEQESYWNWRKFVLNTVQKSVYLLWALFILLWDRNVLQMYANFSLRIWSKTSKKSVRVEELQCMHKFSLQKHRDTCRDRRVCLVCLSPEWSVYADRNEATTTAFF